MEGNKGIPKIIFGKGLKSFSNLLRFRVSNYFVYIMNVR